MNCATKCAHERAKPFRERRAVWRQTGDLLRGLAMWNRLKCVALGCSFFACFPRWFQRTPPLSDVQPLRIVFFGRQPLGGGVHLTLGRRALANPCKNISGRVGEIEEAPAWRGTTYGDSHPWIQQMATKHPPRRWRTARAPEWAVGGQRNYRSRRGFVRPVFHSILNRGAHTRPA